MLNDIGSDIVDATSGIPHISVLGLLLILIYENDIPFEFKLFADDGITYIVLNVSDESERLQFDKPEKEYSCTVSNIGLNDKYVHMLSFRKKCTVVVAFIV